MAHTFPAARSSDMHTAPWRWPLLHLETCVLVACVLAGCAPPATSVSGTVTLDGEPLGGAAVMFYPAAGDGPTTHAFTDRVGRFLAKPFPHKSSVTVSLFRPTDKLLGGEATMEESVPARYADRAKTVLVIEPVVGKHTVCDFPLTMKP